MQCYEQNLCCQSFADDSVYTWKGSILNRRTHFACICQNYLQWYKQSREDPAVCETFAKLLAQKLLMNTNASPPNPAHTNNYFKTKDIY